MSCKLDRSGSRADLEEHGIREGIMTFVVISGSTGGIGVALL